MTELLKFAASIVVLVIAVGAVVFVLAITGIIGVLTAIVHAISDRRKH